MTDPDSKPAAAKPAHRNGARDGVLHAAFAIFAGAMGAVLHLVLEVEPETAVLVALSCLSILVAINAVVRRAGLVAAFDAEIADLKAELANLKARPQPKSYAPPARPEPMRPMAGAAASGAVAGHAPLPVVAAAPVEDAARPPIAHVAPAPHMPPQLDTSAAAVANPQTEAPPPLMPSAATLSIDAPLGRPATAREAEMAPYWTHRPGTSHAHHILPGLDDGPMSPTTGPLPIPGAADARTPLAGEPVTAPLPVAPVAETTTTSADVVRAASPPPGQWPTAMPRATGQPLDLGTMQSLIEQLALQLNQPRAADDEPETVVSAADVPPRLAQAPHLVASTSGAQPHWPAPTATSGHAPLRRLPLTSASMAPLGRLAMIAEAVEANRMDVYLDPILGLADRKARHFELSVRLLTESGDELGAGDYMGPAGGTGLLARIDSAKLARAAEVAQKLKQRGSRASLFSNIAGESLADETFIGAFADILDAEEGLGAKLVLTFTQADARAFTGAHWEAISAMSEIGLKFALEDVRDLDMDFALLRYHGFDFVKLDAAVFLDGLPTPSGHVPAVDICRHMSELGLGLIVGGIVAEKDLARILGFGALLGQGTLFGAPRSVQLDVERRAA